VVGKCLHGYERVRMGGKVDDASFLVRTESTGLVNLIRYFADVGYPVPRGYRHDPTKSRRNTDIIRLTR
jgi:hypothetical protein